jgi:hypothetical protein
LCRALAKFQALSGLEPKLGLGRLDDLIEILVAATPAGDAGEESKFIASLRESKMQSNNRYGY